MKTLASFLLSAAFAVGATSAADDDVPAGSLSQVKFGDVVNEVDFKPDELTGKVVVVEKWGTQCGPCIAFLPELAKIAKRYEKKGLAVVGMEVQQSKKDDINELLKDAKVKYPVVAGGSTPVNADGIPHAHVFGPDGKLLWAGNPHEDGFMDSIKDGLRAYKKMPEEEPGAEEESEDGPLVASRDWTNSEGKSITAEVLRVEGGKVIFRMNGREVPYQLDQLVEEDQKTIREAAEQ